MQRRSFLFTGAAALAGCATRGDGASGRWLDTARIDAAVERVLVAGQTCPGLGVALYTRDGVYARGYGVTDVETGEAATADTAFYIASSTKPLTALALAKIHDRGELDLDMPLARYAPEAPFPPAVRANDVTFRHLLSHTHGIANNPIANRLAYTGQHDPATLWGLLGHSSVNAEAPLGAFEYTNVGYNIATVLTDRRMGVAWQDMLAREVFAPAGMTRTSARMSDAERWSRARPHMYNFAGGAERIYLEKTDATMQSAGGVIMSANDAVRWLELLCEGGRVGGRRVAPASVIEATRVPLADTGEDDHGVRVRYGLGWNVTWRQDEPGYYHSGGFAGFRSMVSHLPQRGIGVAVFANDGSLSGQALEALMYYLFDLTQPGVDAEAQLTAALDAAIARRTEVAERIAQDRANRAARPWTLSRPRAAYAGRYHSDLYGDMEVTAEGERLTVEFGVLHALAEPFTRPDSIRLELVPGSGSSLLFDPEGPQPAGLTYQDARFERV